MSPLADDEWQTGFRWTGSKVNSVTELPTSQGTLPGGNWFLVPQRGPDPATSVTFCL